MCRGNANSLSFCITSYNSLIKHLRAYVHVTFFSYFCFYNTLAKLCRKKLYICRNRNWAFICMYMDIEELELRGFRWWTLFKLEVGLNWMKLKVELSLWSLKMNWKTFDFHSFYIISHQWRVMTSHPERPPSLGNGMSKILFHLKISTCSRIFILSSLIFSVRNTSPNRHDNSGN